MRHYVFALDINNDDNALLSEHPPEADERAYLFRDGVPQAGWFPRDAEYAMNHRYPDARSLYDLQNTTLKLLVVSKALRSILEELDGARIEFLPITIRDHRNKVASKEYSIANVLGLIECVDHASSSFDIDPMIPTRFSHTNKLVLVEEAIPKDRHIFRLKERPWCHIVTETLKKAVEDRGLRGMCFVLPEEFDSTFYRCA